jgi:hypothetical protein
MVGETIGELETRNTIDECEFECQNTVDCIRFSFYLQYCFLFSSYYEMQFIQEATTGIKKKT